MHWLKKGILCTLSFIFLIACKEEKIESESEKQESPSKTIEDFIDTVIEQKKLNHEEIERLIAKIDTLENGINAYTIDNKIDPGKILFSAKSDTLFNDFLKVITEMDFNETSYKDYSIWRKTDEFDFEISLSPHPTENWLLMVR